MYNAHGTLPYAGGWLNQPAWIVDDFENLWLLEEWHTLNADLADPSKLQPFENILK